MSLDRLALRSLRAHPLRATLSGLGVALGVAVLPPPVTVLGIDPVLDPRLHTLALASGDALGDSAARSALISERLALEDGLAVGSPITIEGAGERVTYRVIGILAGDGPSDDA